MDNMGTWKMFSHQSVHTLPIPATTSLTATANHVKPHTSYLVNKTSNPVAVARDGMIIQPTLDNSSQPAGRFAKWPVHALSQFYFDHLQCRTHAFSHRMSMDCEPTILSNLGTLVCETKEIENFRSALAASFTSFARIATKLDQTRFSLVEIQTKLGKPRAEFFQTRRCFILVLEANHEVIRITYYYHITAAAVFPPPLDPQVKHIMQEYVRK